MLAKNAHFILIAISALVWAGCGDTRPPSPPFVPHDGGERLPDAGRDAGVLLGDAEIPLEDAGPMASDDAGMDAGPGNDAGSDAGTDAGPPDADLPDAWTPDCTTDTECADTDPCTSHERCAAGLCTRIVIDATVCDDLRTLCVYPDCLSVGRTPEECIAEKYDAWILPYHCSNQADLADAYAACATGPACSDVAACVDNVLLRTRRTICVCETGYTACSGNCKDLTSDSSACGDCTNRCSASTACRSSVCIPCGSMGQPCCIGIGDACGTGLSCRLDPAGLYSCLP